MISIEIYAALPEFEAIGPTSGFVSLTLLKHLDLRPYCELIILRANDQVAFKHLFYSNYIMLADGNHPCTIMLMMLSYMRLASLGSMAYIPSRIGI